MITLILQMRKWDIERRTILALALHLVSGRTRSQIWSCSRGYALKHCPPKRRCVSENSKGIIYGLWLKDLGQHTVRSDPWKYFTIIKTETSYLNVNNDILLICPWWYLVLYTWFLFYILTLQELSLPQFWWDTSIAYSLIFPSNVQTKNHYFFLSSFPHKYSVHTERIKISYFFPLDLK